jgi:hypothetical protein
VFRAAFRGEPVAAKVVDLGGSSAAQFVREAAALAELRHPAVVGFFGVSLVRGRGVLVMELMEGGWVGLWERVCGCVCVCGGGGGCGCMKGGTGGEGGGEGSGGKKIVAGWRAQ